MPTNYWDSTYGRGIGGPNATNSSPSSSYTSYTPPSTGTQQAQNETSNMSASDWWDVARFAYGAYRDRNPPEPEFKNVPLSPEQQEMYRIYIASLLNPATVNNASALQQMATQQLGGLSNMQWQSPQTFSGNVGYSGSSLAFSPPQSAPGSGVWPGGGAPGQQPSGGSMPPGGTSGAPGGAWSGNRSPLPPFGSAGVGGGGSMGDFFERFAGKWNENEETYEKWLSRAASIAAGALGFPIPANLIDKGIDAAQWVYRWYRKMTGGGTQQTPFDRFYENPTSGEFGSAYGPNERPPGFSGGGSSPNTGGFMGSRNTPFSGFGGGFGEYGSGPSGYPDGRRTMFNPAPPASGVGTFYPERPSPPFGEFGQPGSIDPSRADGPPPGWDKRDDYNEFNGFKMPGWYDPRRELSGGVPQPIDVAGGGRFRNWANT